MNIAVVLAGGSGTRTGYAVPKQYLTIHDTPIIVHTLLNLQSSGLFDEIYVVCAEEWKDFVNTYAKQYKISAFRSTIPAGQNRNETVCNGIRFLRQLGKDGEDIFCMVDGNRPLTPHETFRKSMEMLTDFDAVLAYTNCYDSVFTIDRADGRLTGFVDRDSVVLGQTPMTTRLKHAYAALSETEKTNESITLSGVMLQQQKTVGFVENSVYGMKITTAEDFSVIKALLENK